MKKIPILAVAIAIALVGLLLVLKFMHRPKHAPGKTAQAAQAAPQKNLDRETVDALLKNATALEDKGQLLKAREALRSIMATHASSQGIEDVQKQLEDLNMRITLSGINIPNETATREVKEGDSLSMIADEYHTTVEFLKKQNGLSSDVIRPGQHLRVWTGKFSVLVNKSQNLLFLKSNDEVVKTYHVSTGKDNITPVGSFKVVTKLVKPAWTHDGKVIPADSPENILGTRWLGFNLPGYGIHGTTQPESIGQQATAGCVRMLNNEVEQLYDLLPVNTEVTIMD